MYCFSFPDVVFEILLSHGMSGGRREDNCRLVDNVIMQQFVILLFIGFIQTLI